MCITNVIKKSVKLHLLTRTCMVKGTRCFIFHVFLPVSTTAQIDLAMSNELTVSLLRNAAIPRTFSGKNDDLIILLCRNEPWHKECFVCQHCSCQLAGQKFASRYGQFIPILEKCCYWISCRICSQYNVLIYGLFNTTTILVEENWHI